MSLVLHLGDCIEYMRTLESGLIDAIITDPPYGNNTQYDVYEDTREALEKFIPEFMGEALRVANRVFITSGVANMWLYPEPTWTLCWVNKAGVGSSKWGFTCWQPILAYGKDPFLQDRKGRRPDTYFQTYSKRDKNGHPCPKPTDFMRWLVERTTREGETIFDPMMGSGTTGVVCKELNRNFVGCELSEEYFNISKERIELATPIQERIY